MMAVVMVMTLVGGDNAGGGDGSDDGNLALMTFTTVVCLTGSAPVYSI